MRWFTVLLCVASFAQSTPLDEDLLAAARKGDLAAVKSLLDKGAPLEAKSRYGQTPLFFAARNGHADLVNFLLSKGANPNITDTFYKESLLSAAADKGGTSVVKALIDAGAKGAGDALNTAAYRGNKEMAEMLLATGKATQPELDNALDTAEEAKQTAIADLLRKAGAKPLPKPTYAISAEKLQSYAGNYKGEQWGDTVLELKDGKLFLKISGQSLELGAFDDSTLTLLVNTSLKLHFLTAEGKVTGFEVSRGDTNFLMKRVETK